MSQAHMIYCENTLMGQADGQLIAYFGRFRFQKSIDLRISVQTRVVVRLLQTFRIPRIQLKWKEIISKQKSRGHSGASLNCRDLGTF